MAMPTETGFLKSGGETDLHIIAVGICLFIGVSGYRCTEGRS